MGKLSFERVVVSLSRCIKFRGVDTLRLTLFDAEFPLGRKFLFSNFQIFKFHIIPMKKVLNKNAFPALNTEVAKWLHCHTNSYLPLGENVTKFPATSTEFLPLTGQYKVICGKFYSI